MASLVLGAVGAGVGFLVGGPLGAKIGFSIGSALGGGLGGEKIEQEGPRLTDLKVQASTYGTMIPITYGTVRITGNVIWSTDKLETVTTEESGGKGGGGPEVESTTYSYRISCAIALCEGEISGLIRIWANGKLIFDGDNAGPSFTVYNGTETQTPSPLMEGYLGAGNVPAYRGLSYIEFADFQLAEFGNQIPNFSFEITRGPAVVAPVVNIPHVSDAFHFGYEAYSGKYALAISGTGGLGDFTNKVGLMDITTGQVQVLYENYTTETFKQYVASCYVGTGLSATGPILIDELWITSRSSDPNVYVHQGDSGQLLTSFDTKNTSSEKIEYIKSIDKVCVIPTNVASTAYFYEPGELGGAVAYITFEGFTTEHRLVKDEDTQCVVFLDINTTTSTNIYFANLAFLAKDEFQTDPLTGEIVLTEEVIPIKYSSADRNSAAIKGNCFDSKRTRFVFYTPTAASGEFITIDVTDPDVPIYTQHAVFTATGGSGHRMIYLKTIDRYYILPASGNVAYIINPNDFTLESTVDYAAIGPDVEYVTAASTLDYAPYIQYRNKLYLSNEDGVSIISLPAFTAEGVPLSFIVEDLCIRAGLSAEDVDVSELSDTVLGFTVSNLGSARSAIEALQTAFFFDAVESQQ